MRRLPDAKGQNFHRYNMAIITPQFEIKITTRGGGLYRIPAVKRIEVSTSRDSEPDTAKIEIPAMNKLDWNTFSKGDEVEISFGHKESGDPLSTCFLGQIAKIGPRMPVTIACEDFLAAFKKCWHAEPSKAIASDAEIGLNDLMQDLINNAGSAKEGIEGLKLLTVSDFSDIKWVGQLAIGNRSYSEVLDDILKLGWDLFMLPGTRYLYFGPRNNVDIVAVQEKTPIFRSGLNILDSDLDYISKPGVRYVEVRVSDANSKSTKPDGFYPSQIKFKDNGEFESFLNGYDEIGDREGKIIKQDLSGISKSQADNWAKLQFDINSQKGISGSLKTFGLGYFKHWMNCKIEAGFGSYKYSAHNFPSGIDYIYSPLDGFKMTVKFESSKEVEGAD